MTGRIHALAGVLALLLALSWLADLARGHKAFVINESPSVAPGLYRRTAGRPGLGDLVALDPPPAARAYLARLGAPSDARLLKRIVAVQGATVCAGPGHVRIEAVPLSVARRDAARRPLPVWSECRSLGRDEVFLAGDTPTSFDSRYFGPARTSDLVGPYREVVTW